MSTYYKLLIFILVLAVFANAVSSVALHSRISALESATETPEPIIEKSDADWQAEIEAARVDGYWLGVKSALQGRELQAEVARDGEVW